jgi:hypothetical protein
MRTKINQGANCVYIFMEFGVYTNEIILNMLMAQQVDNKGIGS